jgi:hypothetical protein
MHAQVELLKGKDDGACDHDVLLITFDKQALKLCIHNGASFAYAITTV